jgi:hypothetical protein
MTGRCFDDGSTVEKIKLFQQKHKRMFYFRGNQFSNPCLKDIIYALCISPDSFGPMTGSEFKPTVARVT